MKKVYKIIISAVSLIVIVGICFIIMENIKSINVWLEIIAEREMFYKEYYKLIAEYSIYMITKILAILLLAFFNFLLWYKQIYFMPLTAAQKIEREKILKENKKKKLQEKLNKLN